MTEFASFPSSSEALGEILRDLKLCHPGWEQAPRAAFPRTGNWEAWKSGIFTAVIRPRLLEAWAAAASGNGQGILTADRRLDEGLPEESAASSRRAGRFLIQGYSVPPAERIWARYARTLDADGTPGHLATVLAVRGAAFSLPPMAVATACLFLEARTAGPDLPPSEWLRMATEGMTAPGTVQFRAA